MKIAIFGYPRSGTTMLHDIITQHLVAAGLVEPWAGNVGEAFNPLEGTQLTVEDGHLINRSLADDTVQSRAERYELFRDHLDDNYIVKVMAFDMKYLFIPNKLIDAGYKFIAIERRNPLSAYLSSLIAYHHSVWHVYGDEKPVYEPFVVPTTEIVQLGRAISLYHRYRDHLDPSAIIYYEDVVQNPVANTLQRANLYQEGVPTFNTRTKKILSFEDKAKLIINLEEVIEYLTGILMAYNVTMEHNNL